MVVPRGVGVRFCAETNLILVLQYDTSIFFMGFYTGRVGFFSSTPQTGLPCDNPQQQMEQSKRV